MVVEQCALADAEYRGVVGAAGAAVGEKQYKCCACGCADGGGIGRANGVNVAAPRPAGGDGDGCGEAGVRGEAGAGDEGSGLLTTGDVAALLGAGSGFTRTSGLRKPCAFLFFLVWCVRSLLPDSTWSSG